MATAFSLGLNAGPRHAVNNPEVFENDRFKGRANYADLRADLSSNISLPWDFGLRLRVAGQGATSPLISNEDYSLAGADGVRGYLEAEELVDAGVKGTIQLISPRWRHGEHILIDAFTFFDAGRGKVYDALFGQDGNITLRSWGAGLDVLPGEKLTGSLTYAHALDTAVVTRAGSSRVLFVVRGGF